MGGEIRLETLSLKMMNLFQLLQLLLTMCRFLFFIDQETNPEQDNVDLIPIHNVQIPIQNKDTVHEEKTQQPQEQMPLRRSTREKRNGILDDYVVFPPKA